MDLRKEKKIQKKWIFVNVKLWLFLIIFQGVKETKNCLALEVDGQLFENIRNNGSISQETSYMTEKILLSEDDKSFSNVSHFCRYFAFSSRLICNGSIDFSLLKSLQNHKITDFLVENYEAESLYKKKYWSKNSLRTGEWYINLPKAYQKLTGVIQLKDTDIQISVNLNLVPRKNSNGFLIDGGAFSNKVVKISWRLSGELSLSLLKNRTVISINVGTFASSRPWKLQSNLTFENRNADSIIDDWRVYGIIRSYYISENQFVIFKGEVSTKMMKEECRFWGDINVQNVNLVGSIYGSVSPPQNKQITIPKSAFSNMTIENIVFKDSVFFNDFDKNVFEGIKGTKSITFLDSKLEAMPKVDEFFQNLVDLKEIYIEDCLTPALRFGSLSTLKNLEKLSFKGSGPLVFDDFSFVWLMNSNLTHLNLRHSHVKLSVKTRFVLWSVNSTLKYLDLSYSTITEEKDLTLFLSTLKITHLAAEGLQLKKIPTNGLYNVRNSLEYLSLKRNNFKKILEKNMFDNIFNFPEMKNLKELNLMECHINYIERGSFDSLPNLKILNLAYNNFENLQDGWTTVKPQIINLNLRNNGLVSHIFPIPTNDLGYATNFSIFKKLEVLDLSNGFFKNMTKLIYSLGNNLRNLSLSNTNLEDLPENIFKNLDKLEMLDLSYNKNIKAKQKFSFGRFIFLKNLKALSLKQCRISSLGLLQEETFDDSINYTLNNLEYLDISSNNIKVLDFETLKLFPKLKILNLSGNSISIWQANYFKHNRYLEGIFLDENRFETMTNDLISDIKKLKYVKLGNNPFICGPYVYDILKLVKDCISSEHHINFDFLTPVFLNQIGHLERIVDRIKIPENRFNFIKKTIPNYISKEENCTVNNKTYFLDWSDNNYICFSWSQTKFIPFSMVNETFEIVPEKTIVLKETTLLWLPIVAVIGVVITVGIICWKWLDVHLITRAVRNAVALSFLSRSDKESDSYDYHVFVSYSDKDRSWVIENLLPRLEMWSDVKVCLHERDFQVGLSILENIISSIDNSKNIILIVSQAFLKSQWCQYEMHLALHRLLEKGRDQLILVFLENIPIVQRPKTLKFLMMTKTYLEWPVKPKNDQEIELFWTRLLKSLLKLP